MDHSHERSHERNHKHSHERVSPISDAMRLFQEGIPSYEPAGLAGIELAGIELEPETGNPQDSLANLNRLAERLVIQDILARPTGVLVVFTTGEQHYAPGLRVAAGEETAVLAGIAAKAGFGSVERLTKLYQSLPKHYDGLLPAPDRPDTVTAAEAELLAEWQQQEHPWPDR